MMTLDELIKALQERIESTDQFYGIGDEELDREILEQLHRLKDLEE